MNEKQLTKSIHFPFWLLTLSVVLGLTLPVLIQDAMFQDAMLYSSVSRNLAIGHGNFWFLQYSTLNLEGIPSFHEQPPFFFGIQSLFYKVLGDSRYVERLFTLLLLLLNAWLIHVLWQKLLHGQEAFRKFSWVPVFLWIIIPVNFWSFHNNMIENLLSVFTLLAVIFAHHAVTASGIKSNAWALASGSMVFLATFTKGVPGLFPLIFPVLYVWIYRSKTLWQGITLSLLQLLVPVFCYAVLMAFESSRSSLSIWFFDRFLMRVEAMPTASYRLEIVWRVFTELIPVYVVIVLVALQLPAVKRAEMFRANRQLSWLMAGTGLSGSLPLALTMIQKGWYLIPAFPFFAIAGALLLVKPLQEWMEQLASRAVWRKRLMFLGSVLLIGVLAVSWSLKDTISREEDTVTDVYQIGKVVPGFSTMTVPASQYDQYDFILQGFLVRYFNISISPYKAYPFFLKLKGSAAEVPPQYTKVPLPLKKYELYQRGQDQKN
jgi:hypothetical protein